MADIPQGFEVVGTPEVVGKKPNVPEGFEVIAPAPAPAMPKAEPKRTLMGSVMQGIRNIPSSAVEAAKSAVQPFTTPVKIGGVQLDPLTGGIINVAQSTGELLKSLPYAIPPIEFAEATKPTGQKVYYTRFKEEGEEEKKARQEKGAPALAIAKHYEDRYGSWQGFLKAVETDPVGVGMDIASVATLGEGLGLRVPAAVSGAIPKAARAGTAQAAETYAKALGVGPESLTAARKAGKAGGVEMEEFYKGLRNQYSGADYVEWARKNMEDWYSARRRDYERGMSAINKREPIDPGRTIVEWNENQKMGRPYGVDLERVTPGIREDVRRIMFKWSQNPQLHTLEGLDELKKAIGAVYEKVPHQHTTDSSFVGGVYNSIKSQIAEQAPEYTKIMAEYEKASEALREASRTLSLSDKATQDTAFRKLLSTMRSGVNSNYGHRLEQLTSLEEAASRKGLPSALAGQTLSARLPRGLAGYVPLAAAYSDPTAALFSLPFSPRLAGYGLSALGRAERGLGGLADRVLGSTPAQAAGAALPRSPWVYEAGQIPAAAPPPQQP